jgi:hypothetical protein
MPLPEYSSTGSRRTLSLGNCDVGQRHLRLDNATAEAEFSEISYKSSYKQYIRMLRSAVVFWLGISSTAVIR